MDLEPPTKDQAGDSTYKADGNDSEDDEMPELCESEDEDEDFNIPPPHSGGETLLQYQQQRKRTSSE